jgi:hypothetical protein
VTEIVSHSGAPIGKYQIAGNPAINATIWKCFELIRSESIQRRFERLFRQHRDDEVQIMNTYRQLVVGGYLAERGLQLEAEPVVLGKTPDWVARNGQMQLLVEVFSHHGSQQVCRDIQHARVAYPDRENDRQRMFSSLLGKISKYKAPCRAKSLTLVVCVCIDFTSLYEPIEVLDDMTTGDGLLSASSELGGLLVYRHINGHHEFHYRGSPATPPNARLPQRIVW